MIAEHIEVLKRWPGAGNQAVEKTPSVLAYDNEFTRVVAWGSSVGDQHKNQFAHFKLLLHRPTNSDSASVDDLAWKLQATSIRSSSLPRGKTAVDVTADYLRPLYTYIQQILSNTYGEKFLASQTISYVITVPALWSDRSKALTQRAASEAGFNGKVTLVTEPEAAALYCATICDEVDLRVGSKFLGIIFPNYKLMLVCDAGGGTVDLISYEVESVKPFMISECSIGTADACGSVFLNREFEAAVRKRLGKYAEQVLKPRCLAEVIRYFDHFIKVEFKDEVDFINFSIPGAPDIPEADVEDGFMTMTR
jgi:molecular chaperone DnaK (HSP70)